MSLPDQLWVGPAGTRPEPSALLAPWRPGGNYYGKPWGGLWSSSVDLRHGSDWIRYFVNEHWSPHQARRFACWRLCPDPAASILEIASLEQMEALFQSHGVSLPEGEERSPGNLGIDWLRLGEEYDGIHVGRQGLDSCWRWLRDWACESTWWSRFAFSDAELVAEVSMPALERRYERGQPLLLELELLGAGL